MRWERERAGVYRLGASGWWIARQRQSGAWWWVIRYWERRQGKARTLARAEDMASGWHARPETRPVR
jgi:hypothetical protein